MVAGLPHLLSARAGELLGRLAGAFECIWCTAGRTAPRSSRRAMAWIDDAHDETCIRWAAQRPGPTRLVATNPAG